VHHSFPKFERGFILMIKSAKGVENNKTIIYYTYLHIWFKRVFGPLIYKFKNFTMVYKTFDLKKIYPFYFLLKHLETCSLKEIIPQTNLIPSSLGEKATPLLKKKVT
jgi:hypothetical protein